MSRWSYSGRHTSPFASSPNRSPPIITDDDYTYMTPEDILDPSAEPWNARRGQVTYTGATDPDILFIKHRNQTVKLDFAPFSVGEGVVRMGLIRSRVAGLLKVSDVRRLKLRYKNKTLRDDAMPAREAGIKQNSELTCIITEAPYDDSGSSGGEIGASLRGSQLDYEDTISGSRHNRTGGNRRDHDPTYLPTSNTSTSSRNSFPTATATSSSTANRPIPTTSASPNNHSNNNNTSPKSYTPPPGPRSPKETVQDLIALFNTEYRPLCQEFIDRPPADSKTRAAQHHKLSETVLAQILLKLDNVQTEGNEELRRMRKAAVLETQSVLGLMDRINGKMR